MHTKFWLDSLKGREQFEDGRLEDNIKVDSKGKYWVECCGCIYLSTGIPADSCELDNEPFGSTKGRKFVDQAHHYYLLKIDSAYEIRELRTVSPSYTGTRIQISAG
jgi:hypothetical protein